MNPIFFNMFYILLIDSIYDFIPAAGRNMTLLLLTTVMEVLLVCFLLSALQRLPYELESQRCFVFINIIL